MNKHPDAERLEFLGRINEVLAASETPEDVMRGVTPTAPVGVPHVIRTGTSEFIPEIDEQFIAEARATDEAGVIVRDLRLSSAMAVPLVKRGRVVGAL